MSLLLDTHVLLWWLEGLTLVTVDPRIDPYDVARHDARA